MGVRRSSAGLGGEVGRREGYETIARGVILRTYSSGRQGLAVEFRYRGVRCRETLKQVLPTKQGQRFAANLVGEIENAIARGTFDYTEFFPDSPKARQFGYAGSRRTVGQALQAWLADVKAAHRASTHGRYTAAVRQLEPEIGGIRLPDLDPPRLREMVRHWGQVRRLTLKTIRNYLLPLRAVLDQAVNDGEITRNPLDGVKVAKLVDRRTARSSYTVDPFSIEEIRQILAEAERRHGEPFRNLLAFGFFQGLRISELFALQWGDIDLAGGRARVQRSRVERVLEEEVKTAAGLRDVDLTAGGRQALERQQAHTRLADGFVFLRPDGRPFVDYEDSSGRFRSILKRTGIRYRNQYQMRHTFASHMLSGGQNLYYVAQQMGHKDPQMILRVYGKWIESAKEGGGLAREFLRPVAGECLTLGANTPIL